MNKKNPLFSIVIPVYNTYKELPRCIDSILAQTYSDFEMVLVDDGSSDGSENVCDKYSDSDSRIKVFHKNNGGAAAARNFGIKHATGKYLLFVDSDDMWSDSKALSDLSQIVTDQPDLDLVCFGTEIINSVGEREKVRQVECPANGRKDKLSVSRHLVYTNQYFSASYVKMLRRDFCVENKLFFIDGLLSEDIEWSSRVLIACKKIAIYPSTFYRRIRREEGSLTASINEGNIEDILTSIEYGIREIKKINQGREYKDLYLEYWAYQYAMLIGLVGILSDRKKRNKYINRMKPLKWILRYDHVKKVKLMRIVSSLLGLKIAASLLGIYYRHN